MLLHGWSARFPNGEFGVDVFFALSAFLITTLLLEEIDTFGRLDFVAFYLRRVFRLAPAMVIFLTVVAVPTALLAHEGGSIVPSSLGTVFYVNDFLIVKTSLIGSVYAHTWSLAIEEQFYAIWPFVVAVGLARLGHAGRQVALACALGFAVVVQAFFPLDYFLPTAHLVPLAGGALAAEWFLFGRNKFRDRVATTAIGLIVAPCLFVTTMLRFGNATTWVRLAVGVAAALLVLNLAIGQGGVAARVLSSSPMRWLGQRSYGLYLYHRTFAQLIPLIWRGITLRYAGPLVIVLSCAFAELSFRFIEQPVRERGRAWLRSTRPQPDVIKFR
ncbi:MAG: hypothetical protein QOI95_303 [Acidimicrobiaceae bacterium]|jgi:peptidoglycan/LPS O-acetylase OafA/YrhL